jgi:DNA-binding transcriptional regulator YdaS (Cro superfamily)
MDKSALNRAVEIVGGQTALAKAIATADRPVKQGHVWSWLRRNRKVPPEFCRPIEEATNGQVTRYDLRPDVFGPAPSKQEAA